jgi:hypothetical protein
MKLIKISTDGTISLINSSLASSKQIKICPQSLKNLSFFQKYNKSKSQSTPSNISYRLKYKI